MQSHHSSHSPAHSSGKVRFSPPPFPARSEYVRRSAPRTKAIGSWDGWATFFSQLVVAFGFLLFGLSHLAFSYQGPYDSERPSYYSQQAAQPSAISVKGAMNFSDDGSGQMVARIQDTSSGRVYILKGTQGLKALWDSGVRNVAINGHLEEGGGLVVDGVSTP
jgi:hypothetical protein